MAESHLPDNTVANIILPELVLEVNRTGTAIPMVFLKGFHLIWEDYL